MNLVTYADRDMLWLSVADRIAGELGQTLRQKGDATLSVPGGTTPGPVFDLLAQATLDWSRVAVVLNDERWVDEESPRSNTALVRRRLLTGKAAAARLLPMRAETPTPEEGIGSIAAALAPHLPLSVLLLGMGEDGHVASLFPGADRLDAALASDAPPVMALRADAAGEPRITLTAPVLRAAMHVHVLITGAAKRAVIEAAEGRDPREAPVALVLRDATVHWAE